MRQGKPAILTSSLLARKGEAEPSRLADGSVPKDVIALQEELVARVAADIARQLPPEPGEPAPPPQLLTLSEEDFEPAPEPAWDSEHWPAPDPLPGQAEGSEPVTVFDPPPQPVSQPAPAPAPEPVAAPELTVRQIPVQAIAIQTEPAQAGPAQDSEDDELGAAPREDDPPTPVAQAGQEITLAEWATPAPRAEAPAAYGRSVEETPERARLMPFALAIVIVAVLGGLAIWHVSDRRIESESVSSAALPPLPTATVPATPQPGSTITATAGPAEAPPALGAREAHHAPPSAKPAPIAKAEPPKAPAPVTPAHAAASGGYAIQLVSAVSQSAAERAWDGMSKHVGAIAGSHPHEIAQGDLGAKGVRYRVRLTGFESRAEADGLCKRIRAQKQACLVVNR